MNPLSRVYYSGDATAEYNSDLNQGDDHTAADRGEEGPGLPAVAAASWSFQATTVAPGSLALDVTNGQIRQRFQMENNVVATRLDFNQVNRPVVTEAFRQGSEQEFKTESFAQSASASGLLDVLVVIDTSGSMKEEQSNLSTKLMPLLSYVKDADWKIGVVTTDPNAGCLRGLIRKGDRNAEQLFANAVNAGIQGSGNERGILQAVNGLKGECNQNGSWLRTNSTVAVLIVSDEDNCSAGQDCGNVPWARADYLVNYMNSIRKVGVNARTYGLVWHPTVTQSACNTAFHKASIYADAIFRTGGSWGSICESDYSNTLQAISYDLSVILKTQFALQYEPYASSLKVYVNNQLQKSGYRLTGNVLEFTSAPAEGSSIRVEYEFTNEPPKNEFFLANQVDGSTLQVYLDGAPTSAFTYDAGARSIRFNDAPMVYEIKAVYRKEGELKSDFQIGNNANPSSVRVSVDGKATTGFSYSSSTGLVRMTKAPADSAAVSISFDQTLTPKLSYPIYAATDVRNEVRVYDAKTTRAIPVRIENDQVVFQSRDYRALREILVVYPAAGSDALKVDLGRAVLEDSIVVKGEKSGACAPALFTVNGSEVDLKSCKFQANEGILIDFSYAAAHNHIFDLGSLDMDLSQYSWKVAVNGVETKDYSITDNQLIFPDLPMHSKVDVSLFKVTH
ncbi:hypothetical protein [Oligoflexus tunisiensis]|uniref:hypothetical protein n=1 Tax=Oligoflexus tunisiensis TaxID=708132 RepID=UPI00114C9850|nr:hypothetical protein [Oligoflexus tunisiensis]